jgi:hypothetical protein
MTNEIKVPIDKLYLISVKKPYLIQVTTQICKSTIISLSTVLYCTIEKLKLNSMKQLVNILIFEYSETYFLINLLTLFIIVNLTISGALKLLSIIAISAFIIL